MLKHFLRQFYLSKAERNGVAGLLFLALSAWLAPEIYPYAHPSGNDRFTEYSRQLETYLSALESGDSSLAETREPVLQNFDPNTASKETLVHLGLTEKVAGIILKYREHGGRFRTAADLQKIYSLSHADFERLQPFIRIGTADQNYKQQAFAKAVSRDTLFPFDPNTASEAEFLQLGLPQFLVARLLKYREKGGYFFEKTDFKKLYGLSETEYTRLEPFIEIAKSTAFARPAAYAGGSGKETAPIAPIDINAATPEDWQRLPGIGAARAYKIIRYRDKLGGFVQAAQVAETFGLPDSIFQKIRTFLQLASPLYRKINLNTATQDELDNHPYVDFKQAQLLVSYRTQHGPFNSVDDIERIAAFTDREWLNKIKPYLSIRD